MEAVLHVAVQIEDEATEGTVEGIHVKVQRAAIRESV